MGKTMETSRDVKNIYLGIKVDHSKKEDGLLLRNYIEHHSRDPI